MSEAKRIKLTFSKNEGVRCETNLGASVSHNAVRTKAEENPQDWRARAHSVKTRNLKALKNSILTDITLEVGSENTPFKAHKLILALGSPVFEAMFYGPLAEQGETVVIPDIMPDGFEILLKYLYGDVTNLSNEVVAINALIAADKYCVLNLKKNCEEFLCNLPLSPSNIWKLLENAIFLSLVPLVSRCKQYLEKNIKSSFKIVGFLETSTETIKQVLDISSVNVNELFLLKSIIIWGRHKVDIGEAISLKKALKPLLPRIRFGTLTPSEFCQFTDEASDLLSKSDTLAIFKHLAKPLKYSLPKWCCLNNRPRGFSGSSSVHYKEMYLSEVFDIRWKNA